MKEIIKLCRIFIQKWLSAIGPDEIRTRDLLFTRHAL